MKNVKRIISLALAIALAFAFCIGAAAKNPEHGQTGFEELQQRFDSLTDSQRSEIYKLAADVKKATAELISKYAEYGVLDKESAGGILSMMDDAYLAAKENGRLVGFPNMKGIKG